MRPSSALLVFLFATPAFAQTLTIEIDGEAGHATVQARIAPPVVAPAVVAPEPPQLVGVPPSVPRPVVIVPPLSEDDRSSSLPPEPLRSSYVPPEPPRPSVIVTEPPTPATRSENEAWGSLFGVVEGLDLSGHAMRMGRPEISILGGTTLDSQWAGMRALSGVVTGGGGFGIGMRSFGILRAPELRFSLAGSEVDGSFAGVPGAPAEIEVAARSVLLLRAELAAGLQVELGPFTPYALLRGSVAAYWLGVEVRHQSLGGLGSEVLDDALFELGVEVGTGIRIERGFEVQVGLRANFVGPPSLGVTFGMAFGGP